MDSLQDRLLEHMVPDQIGHVGKIQYRFTEMKIVHVHWPKVSNNGGLFLASNGALRLKGKYLIQRPGVFGYNKMGEFTFDLSAINLTIKDNSSEPITVQNRPHYQPHPPRHRNLVRPPDVICAIGHIKVRFHGGAARLCQFLTSLYIKLYRHHLEAQISKVIQETVQEDGEILLSALSVMASMHRDAEAEGATRDEATTHTPRAAIQHTAHADRSHRLTRSTSEGESGKIQRFLDSFMRNTPPT